MIVGWMSAVHGPECFDLQPHRQANSLSSGGAVLQTCIVIVSVLIGVWAILLGFKVVGWVRNGRREDVRVGQLRDGTNCWLP
jgi:hypothetical protein